MGFPSEVLPFVKKGALLSDDGLYRYMLARSWHEAPSWKEPPRTLVIIMLNPSTADAETDDPTVRKCMTLAYNSGFSGIYIVNLFAYRTSSPHVLYFAAKSGVDVRGPKNVTNILAAVFRAAEEGTPVVCAWGRTPLWTVVDEDCVISAVEEAGGTGGVRCWGQNNNGSPKHPLYLANDTPLMPFGCLS